MDEKVKLSAREFAVTAAALGAGVLYGIRDPFFGLDSGCIAMARQTAEESLAKRGLLSMEFDGSVTPSPELAQAVGVCAACQRYTVLDGVDRGAELPHACLYEAGDYSVQLVQTGGDMELTPGGGDYIGGQLETILADGGTAEQEGFLTYDVLAAVQGLPADKGLGKLNELGFSDRCAGLILRGFAGQAAYLSVMCGDLAARTLKCVSFLSDGTGTVQLLPTEAGEDAGWYVSWTTPAAAAALVRKWRSG